MLPNLPSQKAHQLIEEKRVKINASVRAHLAESFFPCQKLGEAMAYSVEAGGKRIRALLCLASFEMFGGKYEDIEPFLVALEFIHTYSLIHDDLPAMDDSSMRRGKPSNHKRFGEAMAILAGDGLLTDAFSLMTRSSFPAERILRATHCIGVAAGSGGMVGGQALDMTIGNAPHSIDDVCQMQNLKTSAIIAACVVTGGILSGREPKETAHLETFGEKIGQAFQLADDLLDVKPSEESGKDSGIDQKNNKPTMIRHLGTENTKARCRTLFEEAVHALSNIDRPNQLLVAVAETMIERNH